MNSNYPPNYREEEFIEDDEYQESFDPDQMDLEEEDDETQDSIIL